MVAYSRPITPAPMTASVRGSFSRERMSSLVKMRWPSNGICSWRGRLGADRDHDLAPRVTSRPPPPIMQARCSVCGSLKDAARGNDLDPVALQLVAGDVDLVRITWSARNSRSRMVMLFFTV